MTPEALRAGLTASAAAQGIPLDAAARQAAAELFPTPPVRGPGGRVPGKSDGGVTLVKLPDADRKGDFMVYPSSFGHAALYSKTDQIVHSPGDPKKVQTDPVKDMKVPTGVQVLVVTTANKKDRDAAVDFALAQRGKPYNGNYFDTRVDAPSYYCSQLVWASYMKRNFNLDGGGWWGAVSPGELAKSPYARAYRSR